MFAWLDEVPSSPKSSFVQGSGLSLGEGGVTVELRVKASSKSRSLPQRRLMTGSVVARAGSRHKHREASHVLTRSSHATLLGACVGRPLGPLMTRSLSVSGAKVLVISGAFVQTSTKLASYGPKSRFRTQKRLLARKKEKSGDTGAAAPVRPAGRSSQIAQIVLCPRVGMDSRGRSVLL